MTERAELNGSTVQVERAVSSESTE